MKYWQHGRFSGYLVKCLWSPGRVRHSLIFKQRGLSHVCRLTYLISRCCVSHLMINVIISFDLWWNSCSFVPPFIHFVIKPVLYLIWKFAFIRLSQNKRHVSCEQSSPDIKNHNRQHRSQVSHETNVRQRPESNSTQVCEPKRAVYCACALRPQPSVA